MPGTWLASGYTPDGSSVSASAKTPVLPNDLFKSLGPFLFDETRPSQLFPNINRVFENILATTKNKTVQRTIGKTVSADELVTLRHFMAQCNYVMPSTCHLQGGLVQRSTLLEHERLEQLQSLCTAFAVLQRELG